MFKSIIIICMLAIGLAAQETNTAILVDEFESVGCCDLRGRIDSFLGELSSNPTNIGLVVTTGPRNKVVGKVYREEMVRSHVLYREFDPTRVRFVRIDGEKVLTRLFRLSPGAASPALPGMDNTYVLNIDAPKLLLTTYPYGDGGLCPEVEDQEMFALFLAANPASRAKVVIRGHSRAVSNRLERDLLRFFVRDQGFDRARIQFTHLRSTDGEGFGPSTEFWYLP